MIPKHLKYLGYLEYWDAVKILSLLRRGLELVGDTYNIAFDKNISRDDLLELELRCKELGYSFESVALMKIENSHQAFFVYPMRVVQQ